MGKKKLSAVIEHFPEQSAVEDIASKSPSLCGVKVEFNVKRIHGHGPEQQEHERIIKVPFSTSHARYKFLQNFVSAKKKKLLSGLLPVFHRPWGLQSA